MKIVEYKKHLVNGAVTEPDFIISGGGLHDPINKTWIGTIYEETERNYYVPDSLLEMNRTSLIQRYLTIHDTVPFQKLSDVSDPHSERIDLTTLEVTQLVDDWLDQNS
jgi:hypothetical protein